jgi:hypothetical protein
MRLISAVSGVQIPAPPPIPLQSNRTTEKPITLPPDAIQKGKGTVLFINIFILLKIEPSPFPFTSKA